MKHGVIGSVAVSAKNLLKVASANLATEHLVDEVRIFSQGSAQAAHIDITTLHGFRHAMAVPPAAGGSDRSTGLQT